MTKQERFAQLYSIIGADNDPFRHVWVNTDLPGRRVLLKIAGKSEHLANCRWDDMKPDTRAKIKARANDLKSWLVRTLDENQALKVAA